MTVKLKKKIIPSWPHERDLARYSSYTALDFSKELAGGKTWIDIGCRTGKALSESRKQHKAKLIGINAHQIKVRKGIIPLLANIPEDNTVYKKYKKKANLVTDIHGAITYCENPLEALIYESCLLKPKAKAVLITLEARLSGPNIHKRIQHFFVKIMKQKITFKKFITYSDNTKTPIKTLRITINGHCQSTMKLENLFTKARQMFGPMKKIKVIAEPDDKSFQIWRVRYSKQV